MEWSKLSDRIAFGDEAPSSHLYGEHAHNYLDHLCSMNVIYKVPNTRISTIACTIGPACREVHMLEALMENGLNMIRLNLARGSRDYNIENLQFIRTAVSNYSKKIGLKFPLTIAVDLKGPEIRTGVLDKSCVNEIKLEEGDMISLSVNPKYAFEGNAKKIYIDYEKLLDIIKVGYRFVIDRGLISVICTQIACNEVRCIVERGGILGDRKLVNIPGLPVELPTLTEKDKSDLIFAIQAEVDIIFLSYVRNVNTIYEIRKIIERNGKKILVFPKIRTLEALRQIDEIIEASDGIVIVRTELSLEIPLEKVFLAQKSIIGKCNSRGKPVICCAEMLDTMIKKKQPSKSDVSDVANAILDGADCILLMDETAKGDNPILCVRLASTLCREAEAVTWQKEMFTNLINRVKIPIDAAETIGLAAVQAATQTVASAILVLTTSGRSARLIAKYRPKCPIIAITRRSYVARQCYIMRGLAPIVYEGERIPDWTKDVNARLFSGIDFGKSQGYIKNGDAIIIVTGWKQGEGYTNTLRIVYVSDIMEPIA